LCVLLLSLSLSLLYRNSLSFFKQERFPNQNLSERNTLFGSVPLNAALSFGRVEVAKFLLQKGASLNDEEFTGQTILHAISKSDDTDLDFVREILKKLETPSIYVNQKMKGKTLKWRCWYRFARFCTRTGCSRSGLLENLAFQSGSTSLHFAVRNGDVDLVNLLLAHGANPSIKNHLGMSPLDCCNAFPEIRGALKKLILTKAKTSQHTITLHRRNSTATEMQFPMYLVPLEQLQRLYGGTEAMFDRIEAHQELKDRGELVLWEDLP
jgi:ankyrin repeat protein